MPAAISNSSDDITASKTASCNFGLKHFSRTAARRQIAAERRKFLPIPLRTCHTVYGFANASYKTQTAVYAFALKGERLAWGEEVRVRIPYAYRIPHAADYIWQPSFAARSLV